MSKTTYKRSIINSQHDKHKLAKIVSENLKAKEIENKIVRRGSKFQVWVKK